MSLSSFKKLGRLIDGSWLIKVAFILLLAIFALNLLSMSSGALTRPYDPEASLSFYRRYKKGMFLFPDKPDAALWAPPNDKAEYAYAGWLYIHGVSPNLINFEHPPLAKYLIGLSEIIFRNENVMGLLFGLLTLLLIFLISKKALRCEAFALIPIYMLSVDKIFIGLSGVSMLDIYANFFICLAILLFLDEDRSFLRLALLSLSLGLALASKWSSGFLIATMFLYLLAQRKWQSTKWLLASVPLIILVYVSTYFAFFLNHSTLTDFLNLQREMLNFQMQVRQAKGFGVISNLSVLLCGVKMPINIIEVDPAIGPIVVGHGLLLSQVFNPLLWPLLPASSVLSLILAHSRKNNALLFLSLWQIVGLASLSIGQPLAMSEHYMLPVLSIGVILIAYFLEGIYAETSHKKIAVSAGLLYLLAFTVFSLFTFFPIFTQC